MFISFGRGGSAFQRASYRMFWSGMGIVMIGIVLTCQDAYKCGKWGVRSFFSGGSGSSGSHQGIGANGPDFSFKAVVACQPKDRSDAIYAKLDKSSPTGEDNFFMTMNRGHELYAGVADGVGGWAEHGYDSSAISRELCGTMRELAQHKSFDPQTLLDAAFSHVKQAGIVKVGGTTALVAKLSRDGKLSVANLGDSWCGVFRNAKLVFQTRYQTVGFNAPYQLAIIPDHMVKEAARKGGSYIQNKPTDADEYNFQLQHEDIVVLATDGVTDNIATGDMELFLKDHTRTSNLQTVCDEIVAQVAKLSKDPQFPSVFSQELSKLTGKRYLGGKEDDITMVVIKVK
ncbi:LAMI_0C04500g1_1 [Lachancea mirantina]|uniref:Protein phosphatase n=1 Tax=Lachancea mirantina TaxID=1230905 RepID=A0A1G4J2Y3_9SACH|nr:LAMI_0C04500g1_1 [Lachancea mirantina]